MVLFPGGGGQKQRSSCRWWMVFPRGQRLREAAVGDKEEDHVVLYDSMSHTVHACHEAHICVIRCMHACHEAHKCIIRCMHACHEAHMRHTRAMRHTQAS